jgi:hypothetical protein
MNPGSKLTMLAVPESWLVHVMPSLELWTAPASPTQTKRLLPNAVAVQLGYGCRLVHSSNGPPQAEHASKRNVILKANFRSWLKCRPGLAPSERQRVGAIEKRIGIAMQRIVSKTAEFVN